MDATPATVQETDVIDAQEEARRYRNGNTTLLELFMRLIDGDDIADVLQEVRQILRETGLLNADNTPNWPALQARKPKRQTWAEAVNECVTDPAERARLLAFDDATLPGFQEP